MLITTTAEPLTAWEDPGADYYAEPREDCEFEVYERKANGAYVSLGIVCARTEADAIWQFSEEAES